MKGAARQGDRIVLKFAKEKPQTWSQFALGSLFRRRGEVDRAIRMHQDLMNREDLPAEQRRDASFELAQDFFKAGLLDHAEQVLEKMAEVDSSPEVHRHLLDIYIQEKDWDKAIHAAKKLEVTAKRNYQKEIANYHCELAITAHVHGRGEPALENLDRAPCYRKCSAEPARVEWLAERALPEAATTVKAIETGHAYFGSPRGMVESDKRCALGEACSSCAAFDRYPALDLLTSLQATAEAGAEAHGAWCATSARIPAGGLDRLIERGARAAPPDGPDLQLRRTWCFAFPIGPVSSAPTRLQAPFFWQCPAAAAGDLPSAPHRRSRKLGKTLARMANGNKYHRPRRHHRLERLRARRAARSHSCGWKIARASFFGPEAVRAFTSPASKSSSPHFPRHPAHVAARAARSRLFVWMMTSTRAGRCDDARARERCVGRAPPLLVGVTVLTSLSGIDLEPGGPGLGPQRERLARPLARAPGRVVSPRRAKICARPGDVSRSSPRASASSRQATPVARVTPRDPCGGASTRVGRSITASADPARRCNPPRFPRLGRECKGSHRNRYVCS